MITSGILIGLPLKKGDRIVNTSSREVLLIMSDTRLLTSEEIYWRNIRTLMTLTSALSYDEDGYYLSWFRRHLSPSCSRLRRLTRKLKQMRKAGIREIADCDKPQVMKVFKSELGAE